MADDTDVDHGMELDVDLGSDHWNEALQTLR